MAAIQELYYKAVDCFGFDFTTRSFDYARALKTREIIRHPKSMDIEDDATFLSVSATPGDVLWDRTLSFRLFAVKPLGEVKRQLKWYKAQTPNWFAVSAMQVVEEKPMLETFGPSAAELLKFYRSIPELPQSVFQDLAQSYIPLSSTEWHSIRGVTYTTGFFTASYTTSKMVSNAAEKVLRNMLDNQYAPAGQALVDTGWGIITRGLIAPEYTALLMRTWRKTFGADYA
jgi:hypothetical protein